MSDTDGSGIIEPSEEHQEESDRMFTQARAICALTGGMLLAAVGTYELAIVQEPSPLILLWCGALVIGLAVLAWGGRTLWPGAVGLAVLGPLLAGVGACQLALASETAPLIALGLALMIIGLGLGLASRQTLWPEIGVAALVVLIVLAAQGAARGPLPPAQPEQDVRIPIPADKIEGGTEFLSPAQLVGLNVVVPNASKTPTVQASTYGTVIEIRGKDTPAVLIEVAAGSADAFQEALLADGARVAFRLVDAVPTATPTAKATPTPTLPGPGDRDYGGSGYLEIEATKVKPRASTLSTSEARLVIVEKREETLPGTPAAVTTVYSARHFCVTVRAFLETNGNKLGAYDAENTAYVLVSFAMPELDALAASLSVADTIWLENETGCQ